MVRSCSIVEVLALPQLDRNSSCPPCEHSASRGSTQSSSRIQILIITERCPKSFAHSLCAESWSLLSSSNGRRREGGQLLKHCVSHGRTAQPSRSSRAAIFSDSGAPPVAHFILEPRTASVIRTTAVSCFGYRSVNSRYSSWVTSRERRAEPCLTSDSPTICAT